ncbi:MAG: putative Ig domain-containing protein [Bacteroidales bacterium]|nr:putative Ig domain-containing protein [Bacteroidales bacterium]
MWTSGSTLTITGWTGAFDGTSGTGGKIFVGTANTALTTAQLARIRFYNSVSLTYAPATILSNGEVVPTAASAPSALSYPTPNIFNKNTLITPLAPTVAGTVDTYSVSPGLPSGLNIDPATGIITGTPLLFTPQQTYTVTATNVNGSTTFDISITVLGTAFYSRVSGNWNVNTTWSYTSGGAAVPAGIFPAAGDVVNIVGGFNVTATVNAACAVLNFTTATATSLTVNTGVAVDVSGAITIPRSGNGSNQINVGTGILNAGSVAFTNGGTTIRHQINISTGTVNIAGNVTQTGSNGSAAFVFTGAGTLNLGGSFLTSSTGTLTLFAGCTVNYNAAGAQTAGNFIYNNLTLSGSGLKTLTGVTVNGILSMEGTSAASIAPTYGAGASLQYNTSTALPAGVEWITPFTATGGVVIANTGAITLNEPKVFNASVPLTINSGATLNTDVTNNYGLTLGGNFVIISGGSFTANASPVTISGTANQNIAGFNTSGTVSMTKTSGTATLTGNLNTGPFAMNGSGGTLNTGGFNINSVNPPAASVLTLSASGTIVLNTASTLWFADSQSATWTAGQTLTINGWTGGFDGTSGIGGKIYAGTSASGLSLTQLSQIRFFNTLTSSYNPATILADGEVVPATSVGVSNLSYPTPNTFTKGVTISPLNPIVTGIVTGYTILPLLPDGLNIDPLTGVISGTPTVSSATNTYTVTATNGIEFATFDVTITVQGTIFYSRATGNWDNNNTWSFTAGGPAVSAGIYPLAGDVVNITGGFNVTANVNAGCVSLTFPSNNTNNNTLTISSGISLSVSGAITIPRAGQTGGGGGTSYLNQIAVGAGTLNAGSIAFTNGGGGTTRHRITITTGTVNVSGDITTDNTGSSATITFTGAGTLRVAGQLMSSGTIGGTLTTFAGSTVEYNGSAAQTVKTGTYLGNLTLSGTDIKTTAGVTVNGTLTMAGTATASVAPTYGTSARLQYNTGTSRTAGPEWLTTFTASNGVLIAGTGEITLNEAKILNNLVPLIINSGASLNSDATGNYGLTLRGNFTNNGTFNAQAGVVSINGTAAQTISGSSNTIFNDLIINNPAGVVLGSSQTVNGILTLTSGNLTSSTSNLLSITNTLTTAIAGGSANSFINGPVLWTLPVSLGTGSTYNLPLGKGTTYLPFSLVNPVTGSGLVTAQVGSFTASTGGSVDGTLDLLSSTEHWSLVTAGNFTGSSVSLTRPSAIFLLIQLPEALPWQDHILILAELPLQME